MNLKKCNYCLKFFTLKGIKKHILICKSKINSKINNIQIIENPIKIIKYNDYLNIIPEDCLKIIFNFYNQYDPFITCKRLNKSLYYPAITCKRLYKIFNPPIGLENSYVLESKNKIFYSDIIEKYYLNDNDLSIQENQNIELYKKIDIMEICINKYESYQKFLDKFDINNNNNKESFYLIIKKREEKYNYLFNKYNLRNVDLYNKYINYIKYGYPKLKNIEEILKIYKIKKIE